MELNELDVLAREILKAAGNERIFAFYGEMGAGKTTLIKALCSALESEVTATSPTFSIVNEYQTKNNQHIYHFDCYRIDDEEEAADIGLEEYFYSGHYCFIEWPEKIAGFLPETFLKLELFFENGKRKIHLKNLRHVEE